MSTDPEGALLAAVADGLPAWVLGALEEPGGVRATPAELDFAILKELAQRVSPADAEAIWLASELGARDKVRDRPDYRERTIRRSLAAIRPSGRNPKGGGTDERNGRFHTASELSRLPSARGDWLMPGYVATGVITEIGGKVKLAGKTTFMLRMVRSILDGGSFLGQGCTRTPAVYLTEERPGTFCDELRRAGLEGRDDLCIGLRHELRGIPWVELVRRAADECEAQGAKLLVIDTISRFGGLHGDAENNAGDAQAVMEPLQEAAARGIAVVCLRHERKSGGEVGESGRGSSAYAADADVVVAIRRRANGKPTQREVHAVSRLDTPDFLLIELIGESYSVVGEATQVASPHITEAVIAVLPTDKAHAKTAREIELILSARHKRTAVRSALHALVAKGELKVWGVGVRGDPRRYWREIDSSAPISMGGRTDGSKCADCGAPLGASPGCSCATAAHPPDDTLRARAEEMIRSAATAMPAFVSRKMREIATEYGITGLDQMTPAEIIEELRKIVEATTNVMEFDFTGVE